MIIHERTLTSRRVRQIEDELQKTLERLTDRIRREPVYETGDIVAIRRKYDSEVKGTIQSAVQRIYLAGLDYVSSYQEIPALITPRDLQHIEQNATEQIATFWRAIARDTSRIITDRTPVQMAAMTALIATATATATLAIATIDKTRQMGDFTTDVTWVTSLDEKVCPICRPLHGKTWNINDQLLLHPITDSHPNCRCRLLLTDGTEVFSH